MSVFGAAKAKSMARWITVVSQEDPDGVELLLEPNAEYPAMKALKEALVSAAPSFFPPFPPGTLL